MQKTGVFEGGERQAIKIVSRSAPWLAPIPSAFFVARAGIEFLGLPLVIAVIAAAILETLGLVSVYVGLWLSEYNANKRKSDPEAPTVIALALGAVYLGATLGLVVVLEVWPELAQYAPAIFPILSVVGAFDLALIYQQERREAEIEAQKAEARERRRGRRSGSGRSGRSGKRAGSGSGSGSERGAAILALYAAEPEARAEAIAAELGIGRSTVYDWLGRLEAAGRIKRNNGAGVQVLEGGDHGRG